MALMLITVMYFAQRGARQGAYTSITFLAALAIAAIITLNYTASLTAYLEHSWSAPKSTRQAVAMTILFGVFGGLFCYPIIRYFSATMPLPKVFDRAAGLCLGIMLGLLLLGMVSGIWFKTPLAHGGRLRISTEDIKPKRPDWFTAAAFEHVVDHSPHRRPFDSGKFLGETYSSRLPAYRSGFWVDAAPCGNNDGLRVFTSTQSYGRPDQFRKDLADMLTKTDAELLDRHKNTFRGRTPVTFPLTDRKDKTIRKILIAIEITVPEELSRGLAKNATPYANDGESFVFWRKIGDEVRLVKCYAVTRQLQVDTFVPLIALFTPKNASLDELDKLLPLPPAFKADFDESSLRSMLIDEGAPQADIDKLVNLFARAGKIVFRGSGGTSTIQITGIGDPKIRPLDK